MKKRWPWLLVALLLIPVGWGGWRVVWEMGYYVDEESACGKDSGEECGGAYYSHVRRHRWESHHRCRIVIVHWCEAPKGECGVAPNVPAEMNSHVQVHEEQLFVPGQYAFPLTCYSLEGEVIGQDVAVELPGPAPATWLGYHGEEEYRREPPFRHPLPYTKAQVQALVHEAALYVQEQAKAGELTLPEGWEVVR